MSDAHDGTAEDHCFGCVFYPPNLPSYAYSEADWSMLQSRACAFEHAPGTADCLASRKTSCSLVDIAAARPPRSGTCE
jgi:hypothetical protein